MDAQEPFGCAFEAYPQQVSAGPPAASEVRGLGVLTKRDMAEASAYGLHGGNGLRQSQELPARHPRRTACVGK